MPLVKLAVSIPVADNQREVLLSAISKAVAEVTGKPERYMMVVLESAAVMLAGQSGPGAYADVRAIGGLTPETNGRLSKEICRVLDQRLGIPSDHVYITYTEVAATNWGHNGKTLG